MKNPLPKSAKVSPNKTPASSAVITLLCNLNPTTETCTVEVTVIDCAPPSPFKPKPGGQDARPGSIFRAKCKDSSIASMDMVAFGSSAQGFAKQISLGGTYKISNPRFKNFQGTGQLELRSGTMVIDTLTPKDINVIVPTTLKIVEDLPFDSVFFSEVKIMFVPDAITKDTKTQPDQSIVSVTPMYQTFFDVADSTHNINVQVYDDLLAGMLEVSAVQWLAFDPQEQEERVIQLRSPRYLLRGFKRANKRDPSKAVYTASTFTVTE